MLGIFSEFFAVFISFFPFRDIISLNVNLYFKRNETFKDLLPSTADVNYIDTKNELSVFECAGSCVFCAGFLYNSESRTCHLLGTRLNETSFNSSHRDIGWELYESFNVCGLGWHVYKTHCYTYLELKATWAEAKDHCTSNRAYLVQIETREENKWIKETLLPALEDPEPCRDSTRDFCCDTWVGASDEAEEEVFQWTNRENVEFTNWNPTEPNNSNGNEDCVLLCHDGRWNDNNCNKTFNIICERYIFSYLLFVLE